jgi:jouberin
MLELNNLKSKEENENQIIEDKKNEFIKIIISANRDQPFTFNMKDQKIWKGFPLSERFWYNFCCKTSCVSDRKTFFIDDIISNPCKIDKKVDLSNKLLELSIIKSGTLEIKPLIMHPYVKMSIINLKTSKYLQKDNFDLSVFVHNEKNLIISYNKNQNNYEYRESQLDFIPPFTTAPYDLREKGESFAVWNEEIIINDNTNNIFQNENIIFFELMDFNFSEPDLNKTFPIAWGYLKLVGYSQTYMGKYKIQLYKYKYRETLQMKSFKLGNNSFNRTPDVLFEFNWIKKEKYQTYLEIELRLIDKPQIVNTNKNMINLKKFRNSVFMDEGEREMDREILRNQIENQRKNKVIYDEFDHMANYKRKILLKRTKGKNEQCIIPDKLLFKFNTDKLGCYSHSFSNNGKYLAAAVTNLDSITTIKIFNVEDGVLKYHFKGHQQIIHKLTWSDDDNLLISSSSDNNVILWHIPNIETNSMENIEFRDNDKIFKIYSIQHPSYVYSTIILPESSKEMMIIGTACFDGNVRIYLIDFIYDYGESKYQFSKINLLKQISINDEFSQFDFGINNMKKNYNKEKNIIPNSANAVDDLTDTDKEILLQRTVFDHRHPNCLVFDNTGRLYIGDSLGVIHIWDLSIRNGKPIINKIKHITHKELEGDIINNIIIHPDNNRRLIIHSRDNCIRQIDISTERIKVIIRYFGIKCNKTNIKSVISPDGEFLLSGSEEGQPYMWSAESGIELETDMYECKFYDAVSDVCWNKHYNMVALSGFGQEYPLLVYVHEKEEILIDPYDLKMKNEENILNNKQDNTLDNTGMNIRNNNTGSNILGFGNNLLSSLQDNTSLYAKEYKMIIEPNLMNNNHK